MYEIIGCPCIKSRIRQNCGPNLVRLCEITGQTHISVCVNSFCCVEMVSLPFCSELFIYHVYVAICPLISPFLPSVYDYQSTDASSSLLTTSISSGVESPGMGENAFSQ